jgi:glycosyltransferase involved in cell wall biosynthesis
MDILFIHQNFPAQFGHLARHLMATRGWRCWFASRTSGGDAGGIRKFEYKTTGGARETTHYCSRTFENAIWHAHGVFEACKAQRELKPDLIVGHSGFGSTLFLRELYPDVPIINYFEYFYHSHGSDIDYRPEFPPSEMDILRARARNAMLLLDLDNCNRGYSPTEYQRSLFPAVYQPKIEVIFDGVETNLFRPRDGVARQVAGRPIPEKLRVVTYVSRGFESMRGFDIFMRTAKRIYEQYPDVLFVCVGSDLIWYGGDERFIKHKTFREHVFAQDTYDLSKFVFTGLVNPPTLVEILNLSDLHIYLTVPFVLSWSLMDALACGCTVLASDTEPVREVIDDGDNGLLRDFFDVEGLAAEAVEVLRDPAAYAPLGERAVERIHQEYAVNVTLPRIVGLFVHAVAERMGIEL